MTQSYYEKCAKDENEDLKVLNKKGWGYRHQQAAMLFFSLTIAYSIRSCMGVALVGMTGKNLQVVVNYSLGNHTKNGTEGKGVMEAMMLGPPHPIFRWDKQTQDIIQSCFFWGYMSLQIPSGMLVVKVGAKRLLVAALCINSALFLVLPWAALYGGWILMAVFRVIQGFSQACIMPGMHTFLGQWSPLSERGRLTGFVYGGQALGTVLGLPLTGFIASSSLGWPGIFRLYGILAGLAALMLGLFGADSPKQHKKITQEEREFIEEGIGSKGQEKIPVPWKKLLSSKGMWAIVAAHVGNSWGQIFLYSEVPSYMDKVVKVNIKANGLLCALPFLAMWLMNFLFNYLTDLCINRKWFSVTNTRKIANTVGSIPPVLGLIALCYANDMVTVEILLVLICGFKVAMHMGFQVNHIDISPRFAGTMMSVSNFVSNGCGSFAPILTGYFVTDPNDRYQWRRVFMLTSALYFITNIVYVSLGTAERADWDSPQTTDSKTDGLNGVLTYEEGVPMVKVGMERKKSHDR